MNFSRYRAIVLYPFLFAIYPLLNLYVTNLHLLEISTVVGPLLLILGATLIIYLIATWWLKVGTSAGLLTTAIVIVLLYYGNFYELVNKIGVAIGIQLLDHRYLLPLWLSLFFLIIIPIIRKRPASKRVNEYLNFLSVAIIGVIVWPGVLSFFQGTTGGSPPIPTTNDIRQSLTRGRSLNTDIETTSLPDVYYLVLDGYGRQDVLQDYYDFDNSSFLNSLSSKGFYVASESRSNYAHTFLSLSSSLNMDYIDLSLGKNLIGQQGVGLILPLITRNRVIEEFNNRGYTTIHFASGWEGTNNNDLADINIKSSHKNQFNSLLLNSTLLKPVAFDLSDNEQRMITLDTFIKLKDIPKMKEPTFTFAHVYIPHPPFIFDRQGNPAHYGEEVSGGNFWMPKEGYADQLFFVNQLVEETVETILAQSQEPPIILIQGDNGPAPNWLRARERMPILNAYYLPEGGDQQLYPTITPVNSFRLIFDLYFDTDFGLLEDKNLYSFYYFLFNLCDITDTIYPDNGDQNLWAAQTKELLKEKNQRIYIDDCHLEQLLSTYDGFYVPQSTGIWAGPLLKLQFPTEPNQDHILRAQVTNILSNENQEINILINDHIIDSATVPPGSSEVAFVIPAEKIPTEPFVKIQVKHKYDKIGFPRDRRNLSLIYHWLEWFPTTESQVILDNGRWNEPLYEDTKALQALNSNPDIVPASYTQMLHQTNNFPDDGIFIGDGWYPLETYKGETFRWVNNDAKIVITAPSGDQQSLKLDLIPGPGLNSEPFELQILDEAGQVVTTAEVQGRETIEVALPLVAGQNRVFQLHVENGGQQILADDPRILNFRVFQIDWAG